MATENNKTLAVIFAEGYTGMTLMQELAAKSKDLPFSNYLAIVDKDRKAESSDISAMSPDLFKVDHYDANHLDSIENVLAKYKKDITMLILIPPAQRLKKECCQRVVNFSKDSELELSNTKHFMLVSSIVSQESSPQSLATATTTTQEEHSVFHDFQVIENMCREQLPKSCELCIVRPGFYCQNLLLYTPQIQSGELPLPIGQSKMNMVDLADVGVGMVQLVYEMVTGATAAATSEEGGEMAATKIKVSKHHQQVYDVLGCEMMSGDELAQLMSKVLEKQLKFKDISNNEAAKLLSMTNLIDPYEAQYLLAFYMLIKQGKMRDVMEKATNSQTNVYEQLTRMKPTSVEEFLNKYKQEFLQPVHPGSFKKSGGIEE